MAPSNLVALFSLAAIKEVVGHGWITSPSPRSKDDTCRHCLSGGAICGNTGYTSNPGNPVVTWTEASVVEVTIAVTAHHKGHYEFSVCDQVITGSSAEAQACLDKHILERASAAEAGITDCQPGDRRAACQPVDPRHPERFYLPPPGFSPNGGNTHTFYMKLPAGLKCEACTMQWRWWTANSCIPAPDYACFQDVLEENGYSASGWGLTNWQVKSCPGGGCNRCSCGEEFRNCVDISIVGGGGGSNTVAPTTTTTMETTTTTMRTTAPSATTRPSMCTAVPVYGQMWGATDEKCNVACAQLTQGAWPCKAGGPCMCNAY